MSARSFGRGIAILLVAFGIATPPVCAQQDAVTIKKLERDIAALKDQLKRREQIIIETKAQATRLEQDLLTAQALAKILQAQNRDLLALIQKLRREIPPPKQALALNSPAQDVKGVVLKVDAKDPSVLQLSIDSDHGIARNQTLEVFRLKPAPRFLGTVRILDVTATSSVGRLILPRGAKAPEVRAGDQVGSRLLSDEKR